MQLLRHWIDICLLKKKKKKKKKKEKVKETINNI